VGLSKFVIKYSTCIAVHEILELSTDIHAILLQTDKLAEFEKNVMFLF